ncbi:hypothetical protein AAMO2058_000316000 [Amorphochlora amoebiformis]
MSSISSRKRANLTVLPLINTGDRRIESLDYGLHTLYAGSKTGKIFAYDLDTFSRGDSRTSSCDPVGSVKMAGSRSLGKQGVRQIQVVEAARLVLALCGDRLHVLRAVGLGEVKDSLLGRIQMFRSVGLFCTRAFWAGQEKDFLTSKAARRSGTSATRIKRVSSFSALSTTSASNHPHSNPPSSIGICVTSLRKKRVLIYNIRLTWEALPVRSPDNLNPLCEHYTQSKELFVPATPNVVEWVSSNKLCIGFERQYTIVHVTKGSVQALCSIPMGNPVATVVSTRQTNRGEKSLLCARGRTALCYSDPKTEDFRIEYKSENSTDIPTDMRVSRNHIVTLHRTSIFVHGLPLRLGSVKAPNDKASSRNTLTKPDVQPALHRYTSRTDNWQWQWLCTKKNGRASWTAFGKEANEVIEMTFRKDYKECSVRDTCKTSPTTAYSLSTHDKNHSLVVRVDLAKRRAYREGRPYRIRRLAFSSKPIQNIHFSAKCICRGFGGSFYVARKGQIYSLNRIPSELLAIDRKIMANFSKISQEEQEGGESVETKMKSAIRTHLETVLLERNHPVGRMASRFTRTFLRAYDVEQYGDIKLWRTRRTDLSERIAKAIGEIKSFVRRMVTTVLVVYKLNAHYQGFISNYIESVIFRSIHHPIIQLFETYNNENNLLLQLACKNLRELHLEDFGTNLFQTPDADTSPQEIKQEVKKADEIRRSIFHGPGGPIEVLPQAYKCTDVTSKLKSLELLHKRLLLCSEEAYKTLSPNKTLSLSADDLIPMLSYIIVQSESLPLFSEAHFITEFLSDDALLGHLGFLVTSLQIALHYILTLSETLTINSNPLANPQPQSRPKPQPQTQEGKEREKKPLSPLSSLPSPPLSGSGRNGGERVEGKIEKKRDGDTDNQTVRSRQESDASEASNESSDGDPGRVSFQASNFDITRQGSPESSSGYEKGSLYSHRVHRHSSLLVRTSAGLRPARLKFDTLISLQLLFSLMPSFSDYLAF